MKRTFKEITQDIDMVLFNNIIQVDPCLELEAWTYYDDESDEYKDIFQYFVINYSDWEYLAGKTDMPLFYSSKCDLFLLWIDFLDNWENLSYEV